MNEYNIAAMVTWKPRNADRTSSICKEFFYNSFEEAVNAFKNASDFETAKDFFQNEVFGRNQLDSFEEKGIEHDLQIILADDDLIGIATANLSSNLF